MSPGQTPIDPRQSAAVLSLLRGEIPQHDVTPRVGYACLRRYECGGYLYRLWSADDRATKLQPGWNEALSRWHRKIAIDNLAALAQFRLMGRHLGDAGIPFIVLKGAAYLVDLYDDPGERMLTDVDLLVRKEDVPRLAKCLRIAGYRPLVADREVGRFEVVAENPAPCTFEVHWTLGLPSHARIAQDEIWERSMPTVLEGVLCRRLALEDSLLFHVAHQAEHYFGPSLKWTIDLREMFRRWNVDLDVLARRGTEWRVLTALHMALLHLGRLFPGEPPEALRERVSLGVVRSWLLRTFHSADPLQLVSVTTTDSPISRYPLGFLLIDRPGDALGLGIRIVVRQFSRRLGSGFLENPSWDWFD